MSPRIDAPISAVEERDFYDSVYTVYKNFSEQELLSDRESLKSYISNPSHPFWERRHLYGRTLDCLLSFPLKSMSVLDYGCGPGEWGVFMATEGADVTLLDLSPIAVEVGLRRARANGVGERVKGVARDASDLSCFHDGAFDLIFANAALHHTLKYPNAVAELVRVMKKGGILVLSETFGNNAILNFARRMRARLAEEAVEQGEGIILNDKDLAVLKNHFQIETYPFNFLSMIKRFGRGHFNKVWVQKGLRIIEEIDHHLLNACPGLKRLCGEVLIVGVRQ